MKKLQITLVSLSTILLASCLPGVHEEPSPFKPVATIQDVMQSIIDPNIDFVWNSVATVSTADGIEEKRPQTNEEWQVIKQHALTVLEAGNLLVMAGRPVAGTGANTSSGGAELSAGDIQHLIDANRGEFVAKAHGLHAAMQQVIAAIDKQDVEEFEKAGSQVEHACEQCHSQFWYPNDQRPQ
ncbi:cytochrome c [Methylomonas sp. LL1]|uniref:cytochrome c n=1 Tax=Methylomonas sp. LL1 TaxID=2785785 RepID=UPI0018C425E6|nr:cytochrome c [Methylomonas sp. LL1]QPK64825.1 cytochrome c [Methylomonas sp. LL1]